MKDKHSSADISIEKIKNIIPLSIFKTQTSSYWIDNVTRYYKKIFHEIDEILVKSLFIKSLIKLVKIPEDQRLE